MSSPVITLDHVTHVWPDGSVALDDVSGTFGAGTTGLVGRNGSGKTTLLRLIAGELTPTSGTVTVTGHVAVLPQDLPTAAGTIADALGISPIRAAIGAVTSGDTSQAHLDTIGDRWDIEADAFAALASLGLDGDSPAGSSGLLDRPVATLSGGEAILVGLAALRLDGAPIVLLDEPTNNLDRDARRRLIDAVTSWRQTLVVVSHDRELLEAVDRIAEIHDHELRTFTGPFSVYEAAIAAEQAAASRRLQEAEQTLRRERTERIEAAERQSRSDAAGRRAARAGGIPKIVAGGLQRAAEKSTAASKALHEGREAAARGRVAAADAAVRDDATIRIDLPATAVPAGRRVLELRLTATPDAAPLVVHGPERIALTGPNGSGKTTLLDAIVAWPERPPRPPAADVVYRIAEVGLLGQRVILDDELALVETISRANPTATTQAARALLARFLFRNDTADRPVAGLSGGERFRLALAAVLLADPAPHLLLLDEPTNNLDLDSVRQLVAALAAYEGALLVVSHDERFLADLSPTRHWTIADNTLTDGVG